MWGIIFGYVGEEEKIKEEEKEYERREFDRSLNLIGVFRRFKGLSNVLFVSFFLVRSIVILHSISGFLSEDYKIN